VHLWLWLWLWLRLWLWLWLWLGGLLWQGGHGGLGLLLCGGRQHVELEALLRGVHSHDGGLHQLQHTARSNRVSRTGTADHGLLGG